MSSADLDPPDPLVGAIVAGRYHVVRKLAVGGMGIVYEARQEPLGRRVALKVIRGDTSDAVSRQRFEREARAASALQHPNVVVVHDFGVIDGGVGDGGLFLAMEYVEGDTLREKLADAGRMPWDRSRAIVLQIARALDEAHSHQLVHRDLKPENVMLVVDGRSTSCKVLDFGLAKGTGHDALLRSGTNPLTRSGGFVGTPGYISPEVLDGADDHPRQDIYALGVVWWELLTGRHPFPAETPMKTLVRQMHEDPPVVDDAPQCRQHPGRGR
jgi:serine/threonine protein kinase